MDDPLGIALEPVVRSLERLSVRYYVGGSVASMVHGEYRQTADVDIVADLKPEHARPLAKSLEEEFFVDEDMIHEAIAHRGSFNVLHLTEFFKVDVFISKGRPYDEEVVRRSRKETIETEPRVEAYMASPEDILLAKLELFRMGGEVSDRQWRDIMGICKTQQDSLDFAYLRRWAQELNVGDLLERAFTDSGLTDSGPSKNG
jgi:hypothetical protein